METKKILEADYLDLVFNNRNKAYGGYELRKHYGRRTLKALGITMALLVGGIGAPFILSELHAKTPGETRVAEKIIPVTTIADIKPPPDPPKPPKPPVPADPSPVPVAPSLKNLPPVIVPPEQVKPEDTPPTAEELKDKLSAAANNPGEPDGIAAALSSDKLIHTGNGFRIESGPGGGGNKRNTTDTFTTVEQMPEFPGGQEGLMAFLRKNVRYPPKAVEVDIQGRVMISFIVNAKGMVEGAKVMRGIGGGCNEEALRVVNAMPKWKPGKQNGQAVKVYYTLPVSFKLM
jgi:protein TonB